MGVPCLRELTSGLAPYLFKKKITNQVIKKHLRAAGRGGGRGAGEERSGGAGEGEPEAEGVVRKKGLLHQQANYVYASSIYSVVQ